MRARAALEQAMDRRAIARPRWRRAQEEHLLQRELALEDVAFEKTDEALDGGRLNALAMQDRAFKVGRVFAQCIDPRFAELLAACAAPTAVQVIRRVLHEDRHHVL